MSQYVFKPIGIVRSPFTQLERTPVQPIGVADVSGTVVIHDEFAPGLQDLDGFSHIFLLYVFHRAKATGLRVKPYLGDEEHGVFATRSPHRPNPIGLSLVRLVSRDGNVLRIAGVDMLDGTPVLDIKIYIPHLNPGGEVRIGWLTGRTDGFATAHASVARETDGAEDR
jgi:tRNA-Thr(GGU) m(6)t(6)A37 methyltransferase TsaA